jgi:hypothetical protein
MLWVVTSELFLLCTINLHARYFLHSIRMVYEFLVMGNTKFDG